ncbi:MAG: hypothetical protein Tsb0010_00900 [Parvularculaceae bacterium]
MPHIKIILVAAIAANFLIAEASAGEPPGIEIEIPTYFDLSDSRAVDVAVAKNRVSSPTALRLLLRARGASISN